METHMKLQVILSSAALAAALSFSAPALAQLSFELAVPGEEEQAVRDACAALLAESTASTIEQDSSDEELTTGSTGGGGADDSSAQSTSGDPASQDYWDVVIAGLTAEQCRAMGL
jgi:hypothetical protein